MYKTVFVYKSTIHFKMRSVDLGIYQIQAYLRTLHIF